MFTQVPNVVFEKIAFDISGGALKTYLAILKLKSDSRDRVTQSAIARRMNIGQRSVARHILELEDLGYLKKRRDEHGMVVDYELTLSTSS